MSTKKVKRGRPITEALKRENLWALLRERRERKISAAKLCAEKGIKLISFHVACKRNGLRAGKVPR